MKKIECKWGEKSEFSRKVIAHFILKDDPSCAKCIDQKVDEWFCQFKNSMYEGDCMTSCLFLNWFNSYFEDLGCNMENVLKHIKAFCQCFKNKNPNAKENIGDVIYKKYAKCIKYKLMGGFCHNLDFFYKKAIEVLDFACKKSNFEDLVMSENENQSFYIDYTTALKSLECFDEEFSWTVEYDFKMKWLHAFIILVHYTLFAEIEPMFPELKKDFEEKVINFFKKYYVL